MRIMAIGMALFMLLFGTAAAAYTNDGVEFDFQDVVTTQGCRLSWDTVANSAAENTYTWSGAPCRNGESINGQGTLTIAFPDGTKTIRSGMMVAGVFNGPVHFDIVGPGVSGSMASTDQFNYGCQVLGSEGLAGCTPRPPSSQPTTVGSTVRAEAQGTSASQRIIARDGAVADCVNLETITERDSQLGGGGRVLANHCSVAVEVGWCTLGGECERGVGNQWNVQPGRSWPVAADKEIRWGACLGADTYHGDSESQGLKFTCSAPAGTPPSSGIPSGAGRSKES